MDPQLEELLLDTAPRTGAERWHDNPWTQGSPLPTKRTEPEKPAGEKKEKPKTVSFLDALATNIDEMFPIYPADTKRDIRLCLKERLIDWVSLHARKFFGPSTSRSISTCLRSRGATAADLEKFAELVSFFLDQPIQAGSKVVVWHGYASPSRDPACEILLKQQGVFVKQT